MARFIYKALPSLPLAPTLPNVRSAYLFQVQVKCKLFPTFPCNQRVHMSASTWDLVQGIKKGRRKVLQDPKKYVWQLLFLFSTQTKGMSYLQASIEYSWAMKRWRHFWRSFHCISICIYIMGHITFPTLLPSLSHVTQVRLAGR
jgi:hypothetical protein